MCLLSSRKVEGTLYFCFEKVRVCRGCESRFNVVITHIKPLHIDLIFDNFHLSLPLEQPYISWETEDY